MGPKKGTKAYKEEYVYVLYGINPRLRRVASVYLRRDRVLSGYNDKGDSITHSIKPGWTAENEAGLIFGLREVFSVPINLSDADWTKKRIEELREKAEKWQEDPA